MHSISFDPDFQNAQPIELLGTEIDTLSPEEEDDLNSGYVPEVDENPLLISPKDRRLITQPYDLIIQTIVDQIRGDSLIVRPPYQRGYVWDDVRASRLIESLLMNIPIPPCYFAEEEDGTNSVIDGQQRLLSIFRYLNNDFPLRGLTTLTEFNTKSFNDLKEREQRLVKGRSIRCIVITRESHPEIRFEVFYRLNTGSVQLTDQEIRNAIYRGDFNDLVKSLAEQPRWLNALNKQRPDKRMRDDELVLRFFAVYDHFRDYQAPLRTFLNQYMNSKTIVTNRRLPLGERKRLQEAFERTVDKVQMVFDDHAFRIYNNGVWERQVNRALFDAIMLVFSRLPAQDLAQNKNEIDAIVRHLTGHKTFIAAISRSTADRGNFYTRIRMFSEALANLGMDSGIHQEIASL